jgi:PAS domain S-box-containing protein
LRARSLLQADSPARLERALRLYSGALLEGLPRVSPTFDDWLTVERERLAAGVIGATRKLLDHYAAAGTPERAIAAASRLVEMEPFREEARRELMLLYAECGQTRAAIAQYEAYAALSRTELGAEPGEATREIHRLLLEGESPRRQRARMPMPARLPAVGRAGEEFLRSSVVALEQMPDCVVVTDLDGRIVGWNQWARRNFGYDKREVLGRKPFFLYGPAGGESVTAELIDKAVRYGRWSGVLRLFNKDGSSRLHKRTMMPLRDENGRIVGVFGVTRPLTRPIPGL